MSYEEIGWLCSGSRSQQNFKMSVTVYPAAVFWNAEPFTIKLCMVRHHHKPECLSKRLICCLQGQSHSEGSCHQRRLSNICSQLPILLQLKYFGLMAPNHDLDCLVKRLDCSVVVKVKVTGKAQNSSECWSQRYLLNCWAYCKQSRYDDASSWARVSCKAD